MFEKAGSGSRAESSWGREKGGWEPMALSEEKLCSVGCKWMYTFNRRRGQKVNSGCILSEDRKLEMGIPVQINRMTKLCKFRED